MTLTLTLTLALTLILTLTLTLTRIPGGQTAAPTIMIAEKAADDIRKGRGQRANAAAPQAETLEAHDTLRAQPAPAAA